MGLAQTAARLSPGLGPPFRAGSADWVKLPFRPRSRARRHAPRPPHFRCPKPTISAPASRSNCSRPCTS
ncbi:hypothetical protein CEG14_13490 [Bordetella genomosp. 1]|uniref:Uncharacterized protein n=1 Tax=Bordetella genomosp. 1 TaxID=1395607 RepID=A0A261SF77_9BORD|nr:hypothetical protein CEG14_13490 [Bordetella genomosp. 1]